MTRAKTYRCPACGTDQPIEHFTCAAGSKGGKATGARKARTSEQARRAGKAGAAARWGKAAK